MNMKLENLEKLEDDKAMKDIIVTKLQAATIKAFDDLIMINEEFKILEYKDKLLNDKDAKLKHDL